MFQFLSFRKKTTNKKMFFFSENVILGQTRDHLTAFPVFFKGPVEVVSEKSESENSLKHIRGRSVGRFFSRIPTRGFIRRKALLGGGEALLVGLETGHTVLPYTLLNFLFYWFVFLCFQSFKEELFRRLRSGSQASYNLLKVTLHMTVLPLP